MAPPPTKAGCPPGVMMQVEMRCSGHGRRNPNLLLQKEKASQRKCYASSIHLCAGLVADKVVGFFLNVIAENPSLCDEAQGRQFLEGRSQEGWVWSLLDERVGGQPEKN